MITDPAVVSFVNDYQHRIAEKIRDLFALLDDSKKKYAFLTVPDDDKEILDDGREAEGVIRVSGADIVQFQAVQEKLVGAVGELTDLPIITKFCVRSILS